MTVTGHMRKGNGNGAHYTKPLPVIEDLQYFFRDPLFFQGTKRVRGYTLFKKFICRAFLNHTLKSKKEGVFSRGAGVSVKHVTGHAHANEAKTVRSGIVVMLCYNLRTDISVMDV